MRNALMWALVCFGLCYATTANGQSARSAAPITCQSSVQQSVDLGAELFADAPEGATVASVDYYYRPSSPGPDGPWRKCPGDHCSLRGATSRARGGDSAITYSAVLTPSASIAGDKMFSAIIAGRVVITYLTSTPMCTSQATFLVEANLDREIRLMIPRDKGIAKWQAFLLLGDVFWDAKWLVPPKGLRASNPPVWKLCEDNQLNHLCAVNRFILTQARVYADESDGSPGMFFSCTNKYSYPMPPPFTGGTGVKTVTAPRWCRVAIQYSP